MSAGGVGGAGRRNFQQVDSEVEAAADSGQAEAAGAARTSIRSDNFAGFYPTKAAVASDGGPVWLSGNFNRSVTGDFTINRGEATFTRKVFGQGEEPARKLTTSEKADLAKALETAIARGGPLAADLRVALSKLTAKAPTLDKLDFSRWDVKSVAIAADGGPVSLKGAFGSPMGWGPGLAGNVTIRRGEATYTQPGMKGKLTAAQEKQLAKALEKEIAGAKGANKKDLQYALAELRAGSAPAPKKKKA